MSRSGNTSAHHSDDSSDSDEEEDNRTWVQCNSCDKWRALPSTVDASTLPEVWTCNLNEWDDLRNTCSAPEESTNNEELRAITKLWLKRLKNGDRAEARLQNSAMTRGRKKRGESDWIKCSNPSCGKWRAVLRGIDVPNMLRKLNKNSKWTKSKKSAVWFCSMNTWDDSKASCGAPQDDLHDSPWNFLGESSRKQATSSSSSSASSSSSSSSSSLSLSSSSSSIIS